MATPNILEPMVQTLADELVRTVNSMPEQDMPVGARALTQEEQYARYLDVRDDPQKWFDLIQKEGQRAVIDYAQKMERLNGRT